MINPASNSTQKYNLNVKLQIKYKEARYQVIKLF